MTPQRPGFSASEEQTDPEELPITSSPAEREMGGRLPVSVTPTPSTTVKTKNLTASAGVLNHCGYIIGLSMFSFKEKAEFTQTIRKRNLIHMKVHHQSSSPRSSPWPFPCPFPSRRSEPGPEESRPGGAWRRCQEQHLHRSLGHHLTVSERSSELGAD